MHWPITVTRRLVSGAEISGQNVRGEPCFILNCRPLYSTWECPPYFLAPTWPSQRPPNAHFYLNAHWRFTNAHWWAVPPRLKTTKLNYPYHTWMHLAKHRGSFTAVWFHFIYCHKTIKGHKEIRSVAIRASRQEYILIMTTKYTSWKWCLFDVYLNGVYDENPRSVTDISPVEIKK